MDMRLGVEPLHVIERRHILKALAVCEGRARYAAELLGIGRASMYRKLHKYGKLPVSQHIDSIKREHLGPQMQSRPHRRKVEAAIEKCGGSLTDAAMRLGCSRFALYDCMDAWHRDNEQLIQSKAKSKGISEDEIEVMLRRRTMDEHVKRCGYGLTTGYKMIDEACALVGLRRYRNWLFLCKDQSS